MSVTRMHMVWAAGYVKGFRNPYSEDRRADAIEDAFITFFTEFNPPEFDDDGQWIGGFSGSLRNVSCEK